MKSARRRRLSDASCVANQNDTMCAAVEMSFPVDDPSNAYYTARLEAWHHFIQDTRASLDLNDLYRQKETKVSLVIITDLLDQVHDILDTVIDQTGCTEGPAALT